MLLDITPILRIFDEQKAKEFYTEYLDFTIDWEHRFEPNMPLYMQLSLGSVKLHLSEHHGDGTPGTAFRIRTTELDALHARLKSKAYRYLNPGIEDTPWNRELTLLDPFGNRLVFYENKTEQ